MKKSIPNLNSSTTVDILIPLQSYVLPLIVIDLSFSPSFTSVLLGLTTTGGGLCVGVGGGGGEKAVLGEGTGLATGVALGLASGDRLVVLTVSAFEYEIVDVLVLEWFELGEEFEARGVGDCR